MAMAPTRYGWPPGNSDLAHLTFQPTFRQFALEHFAHDGIFVRIVHHVPAVQRTDRVQPMRSASAAQRLDDSNRWSLAEKLALHDEDANDANLPLMYWYALEPLVPADAQRALSLAGKTKIPVLRNFVARRLASK